MMKNFTILCGLLLTGFLTFSCSTTGVVFDASVPPEKSAKVWFTTFAPTSYNGIKLEKKAYTQTFPAGQAEFTLDFSYEANGLAVFVREVYTVNDAVFKINMEEGEEYIVVLSESYDYGEKGVFGVKLYKTKIKTYGGSPPADTLVGFIPFDPLVIRIK